MDLLAIYVEHIHPQFPSPRDDYLFLQTSGKRFTNGMINRRLPEMWLRSDVQTDLRVTATNIRKFIVTVLQENKIEGAASNAIKERGETNISTRTGGNPGEKRVPTLLH